MLFKKLNRDEKIQLSKYVLTVWTATLLLKTLSFIISPDTVSANNSFSLFNFIAYLGRSASATFVVWFFINRTLKNQKPLKDENYTKQDI